MHGKFFIGNIVKYYVFSLISLRIVENLYVRRIFENLNIINLKI